MSVGAFGKGLVGKLFDQPDQMYDKDLAKLGDYDAIGNEVRAGGLGSLRSALGSKYADHVDLRYMSGSGSFVLGRDAVPEGFDENELLGIFDTVTAYGSKSARAKLEESLYKADDAAKAKLPHVSEAAPAVNVDTMLRRGFLWKPDNPDEYIGVFDVLNGKDPQAAAAAGLHEEIHGGSVDLQELMLKHGAHVGIVPLYSIGAAAGTEGYGLVDERTVKPALKAYRDGRIEVIDKTAAFDVVGRIADDYRKVGKLVAAGRGAIDPGIEAMADAWGSVQSSIVGASVGTPYMIGIGGIANMVVPKTRGEQQKEKGLWNWAKRNWKGLTITGIVIAAGAHEAGKMIKSGIERQQHVDRLKAAGMDDAAARGFESEYWTKLVGPNNELNDSVKSLGRVYGRNATLARILESYARTPDGDLWDTVKFVADNLGTPQYLPKSEAQAAACSKLIKGVENITESDPRLLTGLFHRAPSYIVDIGAQSADKVSEAYDGIEYVAKYAMKILKSGNATLDGLEGRNLEDAVLPIGWATSDIMTGKSTEKSADTFKRNTYPDSSLGGISPLEWQGKEVRKNLQGGPELDRALDLGYRTNRGGTMGEPTTYHEVLKTLSPTEQKIIEFIYGLGGVNVEYGIPHVEETHQPYYAQSVGFQFFRPIRIRSAKYLSGTGHTDMDIWSPEYKGYVGPMMDPNDLAGHSTDLEEFDQHLNLHPIG
jgi:hypothetical protein